MRKSEKVFINKNGEFGILVYFGNRTARLNTDWKRILVDAYSPKGEPIKAPATLIVNETYQPPNFKSNWTYAGKL